MSYNAIGPKLLLTGPVLPSGKPPQSLFPSRKVKVYRRKRQAILLPQTPLISELLIESNIELIAKNDVHLTDTVYKLLRDQFDYKPILTKKQFLQSGFAEWKIQIVCDILNCVMKKHKELVDSDKTPSCQRKKSIPERPEPCSSSESAPAEAVGIDVTGRFMTSGKDPCSHPEMTALLLALAECQDKLKRLDCVEKRLQGLEAATKGKVMVDEKAWNNLLSRVTLLETEMLLSKKNECSELHAASEDNDSVSVMDGLSIENNKGQSRTTAEKMQRMIEKNLFLSPSNDDACAHNSSFMSPSNKDVMLVLEKGPLPGSGSRDRTLAGLAQLTCKDLLSIVALKQTYQSGLQRPNTEGSWMMVQIFHSPAVLTSSEDLVITFPEVLWLDLVERS
ncbi:hypothetical protein STEG23_003447 [Scotinomys teguina]